MPSGWASLLACPIDQSPLGDCAEGLCCAEGHKFPVADGIPVFTNDNAPTHWEMHSYSAEDIAIALARDQEIRAAKYAIDPDVNRAVVWSSGNLYRKVVDRLPRYPIPDIRLPDGDGKLLLDIGCNWGRWSVAAAQKGYRVIGIDPSLTWTLCARRVCEKLGVKAQFIVGDARHLPFATGSFDTAFSYSVLQHLPPQDAWTAVSEIGRVLKPGGNSLVQLAACFGLRSLFVQARRGFGDPGFFGVRYYTPSTMRREMENRIGPTEVSVDGFLGLGIQSADLDMMGPMERTIIRTSEGLRKLSEKLPVLKNAADSLYLQCRKPGG